MKKGSAFVFFVELFTNEVLIVPIVAWLIAQVLKTLINSLVNGKLTLERMVGDGGMPSAHTATVVSLMLMCGFTEGWGSTLFALSAVFAVVVMHDATGVRQETGKQAVVILDMIKVMQEYFWEKDSAAKAEKLKIFVGHSKWQVFCGMILGVIIVLVYWFLIRPMFPG
jgi:acid phosphatase family membrane protein YuiD